MDRKLEALGTTHDGAMRRIGYQHMVVMPARTSKVVHINTVINDLERANEALARAQQQVQLLTLHRAQLEQRLAEFRAAPIERVDGDPNVPLAPPEPELVETPDKPADTVPSRP